MDFYVTIGDIRDTIHTYLQKHQTSPKFPEILHILYDSNKYLDTEPVLPDIGELARLDEESFLSAIRRLYFCFPNKILSEPETFDVVPPTSHIAVFHQFWGTYSFVHLHDCFEINYVFKGECEFTFLDEKRILKEGDFCIISPYTNHNVTLLTEDSQIFPVLIKEKTFSKIFFPLLPEENLLSDFFRRILSDKSEPNYLLFQTSASLEIRDLMKRLFLENFRQDKYVPQNLTHWLYLLFSSILRDYQTYSQFSSYKTGPDYAPILRYIQNHYTTITLTELSKIFHYSVPYLSKIIKDTTEKNFVTLVRELKMRAAIQYLEKTTLSMEEISIQIGYNSEDHFYRIFSSFYGISPLKYRQQYRKKHQE